jgi:hypothetical protein
MPRCIAAITAVLFVVVMALGSQGVHWLSTT